MPKVYRSMKKALDDKPMAEWAAPHFLVQR
jgi:hypothetical protein